MQVCEVRRLGRVPYAEAWELQKDLAARRAADAVPDTLLLLEHPHTYTLGRSGHAEHLLLDEGQLAARGIALHWVDRGGDITYHGPGQLVGYPIIRLGALSGEAGRIPQADYVGYVRRIEETLIRALAAFGLVSGQVPGLTGVWVQPGGFVPSERHPPGTLAPRCAWCSAGVTPGGQPDVASRCAHCPPAARRAPSKIAAIGVKVDARGVTQHGFALNVNPDMRYWDGIVGCGLPDHVSLSMTDLLDDAPQMAAVMDEVAKQFGKVFEREMISVGVAA